MICTNPGHSAEISMSLIVGGQCLTVRGAGPNELVLAKPAKIPPSQAELIVTIDGDERKSLINLSGSGDSETVYVAYTSSPYAEAETN